MTNEELLAIMEQERAEEAKYTHRIHVCTGTGCVSSRSEDILAAFEAEIKARGLDTTVKVKKVGCMGLCAAGPIVSIQPDNLLYKEMTPELVPAILDSLGGEPIKDQLIDTNIPFFYRQEKNALENTGVVDPERIEDYIATGGYSAVVKVLSEMPPTEVIQEILNSGLRGRGGAGYAASLLGKLVSGSGTAGRTTPATFLSLLRCVPHGQLRRGGLRSSAAAGHPPELDSRNHRGREGDAHAQ